MSRLSKLVFDSMTKAEHNELNHLSQRLVELTELYAQKLNFDLPPGIPIESIKDQLETANVMLEVFQESMAEKYPLKPLVDIHMTPKLSLAQKTQIDKMSYEEQHELVQLFWKEKKKSRLTLEQSKRIKALTLLERKEIARKYFAEKERLAKLKK